MYDMRYYIDRQPEAMKKAIAAREEISRPFVELWVSAGADRLYLVGSGTSGNAARAAAPFMQQVLDTEVTAVSPTSLPSMLKGKPFFLFISQGGQSTNTVRAIEQMASYPHLALTGETECRINHLCPHVVLNCGHEEAGPKTMGYTATILTLYLMALEAARKTQTVSAAAYDACADKLERMADRMAENISVAWQWVQSAQNELLSAANWAAAGVGVSHAIACESALKLMETLLRPAAGFEFEEYLHGPTMMLNAGMGGIYLLPADTSPDRARMEALADLHRGFHSPVITVRAGEHAALEGSSLTMAADPEDYLMPFWQILPGQVMGAFLPAFLETQGRGHNIFKAIDEAVGVKCKTKE